MYEMNVPWWRNNASAIFVNMSSGDGLLSDGTELQTISTYQK